MKSTSHKKIIALICVFSLIVLFSFKSDSKVSATLERDIYRQLKIFNEILDLVKKNYVEEVSTKALIEGAINGMMKSLDPHSTYMTAEMYKDLEVETKGSFGGIGIEITIKKDVLTVVSPIEDTPAFHAGVKAGDQIIMIDGKPTKDITLMEAVKRLRGPKDSKVTITIMRENLPKPKDITLTRAIIKVKSVKWKVYDENIGYIRISAFHERTSEELKKAIHEMESKAGALKGAVIDLRNNPGGLLTQAVQVSDVFLKSGTIVTTKGRAKGTESISIARDDGYEPSYPLVVIVNEGTASAAEIVSGALQDNEKALVIGTHTFGKGSVQTVIPLEDGSALKLTTARYYTPNGRSIQAEGIKPDIVVKYVKPSEEKNATEESVRERDLQGHIKSKRENGTSKGEPERHEESDLSLDNQLKSAIDILKSWEFIKKKWKG